jgi:tetratricopeptide (TPR) repeat protein
MSYLHRFFPSWSVLGGTLLSIAVLSMASAPMASAQNAAPTLPLEMQGDLQLNLGNYAAALDCYRQVSPKTAFTWNKTGLAYHHLFAIDEALKDYKMAISLNPHFSEAYNNIGAIYHARKEYALAEKAYRRAIKLQPRSAVSYSNLGTTYFAEHKYKQGTKAYSKALQLDWNVFRPDQRVKVESSVSREDRISMNYSLAKAFAGAGRNDDALAALHKAMTAGFSDVKRLLAEKEFATLRTTPGFRQLLTEQHLW